MRSAAVVCLASLLAYGTANAQATEAILRNRAAAAAIPDGKMPESDRGRLTARAFADCLAKRKPVWVDRLLGASNDISDRMIARADMSECLAGGSLRFQPNLLRGALFGAEFRSTFGGSAVAVTGLEDPAIVYPAGLEKFSPLWIADCAVRKDASSVRRILISSPAAEENNAAYGALTPALKDCITPGLTLRFSKATIDGYLAEALYRRTAAAAGAASTGQGTGK